MSNTHAGLRGAALAGLAGLIALVLTACGPSSKVVKSNTASLTLIADATCDLSIDGLAKGRIPAQQVATLTPLPGQRLIQCQSVDEPTVKFSSTQVLAAGGRTDLRLEMAGQILALQRFRESVPGGELRDCPQCPVMVVVPRGEAMMGSWAYEFGRSQDEGPEHPVAIGYALAVGKYEVTRGEFRAFIQDSGWPGGQCQQWNGVDFVPDPRYSWENRPDQTSDAHPATCLNWDDAQAYARWLSLKTGKRYRLLTEAEWEYAARGGRAESRHWGDALADQCGYANGADASGKRKHAGWSHWIECDDGFADSAPVGSLRPNGFGLFDVMGNVWEWVEDCAGSYDANAVSAHAKGAAVAAADCPRRVIRGGASHVSPRWLRSAFRGTSPPANRLDSFGLRVARVE